MHVCCLVRHSAGSASFQGNTLLRLLWLLFCFFLQISPPGSLVRMAA